MTDKNGGRRLLSLERRQRIMEYLRDNKSVDVSFLSTEYAVSSVTIRQDLDQLERQGLLTRTRGGAVLNQGLLVEPSFTEKVDRLKDEKAAIAAAAAQLISNDMTVAMSTGTTVSHMINHLVDRTGLTVVTNAMNVANAFMQRTDNRVFLTGGMARPNTFALIGEAAERSVEGLVCEYAFIGTNGISAAQGMTTPSSDEARVVRALMECANRVVLLVDHSKFEHVAFYRIAHLDKVHTVITDAQAPEHEVAAMREAGIQVIVTG